MRLLFFCSCASSWPHLSSCFHFTLLLQEFPHLGILPALRKLSLSHNGLRALPPTTPSAVPALSELRLAHNKLTALPPASALAPWSARLRVLDVGHNRLRSFVDVAAMLVGVRVLTVAGNVVADAGTWAAVRVLDGARVDGCGRGGRPLDPAMVAAAAAARVEREAAAAEASDAPSVRPAVAAVVAAAEGVGVSAADAPAVGRPAKRARRAEVVETAPTLLVDAADAPGYVSAAPAPVKDTPAAATVAPFVTATATDGPPLSFDDAARSRQSAAAPGDDAVEVGGGRSADASAAAVAGGDDGGSNLLAASAADAAATVVKVTVARRAKEKGRGKRQRARAKREAEAAGRAEAGIEENFGLGGESAW